MSGDWKKSRRIPQEAYEAIPLHDRFERPGARALLAWEAADACMHLGDAEAAETWRVGCEAERGRN